MGEKPFVFNIAPDDGFDAPGAKLANAANSYWVAFARSGDPGKVGDTPWPVFEPKNEARLEFPYDGTPVVRQNFNKQQLDWVEKLAHES